MRINSLSLAGRIGAAFLCQEAPTLQIPPKALIKTFHMNQINY